MMHLKVVQGLQSGFKTRQGAFLGLFAIALALVPALMLASSIEAHQSLNMAFISAIGPSLWVSIAFSIYLASIACLQQYHRSRDDFLAVKKLAIQVDVVVSASLFVLIIKAF